MNTIWKNNNMLPLNEAHDPYRYAALGSSSKLTLDELEDFAVNHNEELNELVKNDKGIQKRYPNQYHGSSWWKNSIEQLKSYITFYKPEKFGQQYVIGYRTITLDRYLDFNEDQPGMCWSWNSYYQKWNEERFILNHTGGGVEYILRLKAYFDMKDVDWLKTVYLMQNNEGELRLHADGKAYVFNKRMYEAGQGYDKYHDDYIMTVGKQISIKNLSREETAEEERLKAIYMGDEARAVEETVEAKETTTEYLKGCFNPRTQRYDIDMSKLPSLSFIIKDGKFTVPIGIWKGAVDVESFGLKSLENGPLRVTGSFECCHCDNLTSLEGAPEYVGGNFRCWNCKNLTSLEGAPKHVGGDFNCSGRGLTSLKGAPEKVKKSFSCSGCSSITSLEGAPKEVGGDFNCGFCSDLISLVGAPEKVEGDFKCFNCDNLTSLKGAPKEVDGVFNCEDCHNLTSLEGAPEKVKKSFYCGYCLSLTSLKGAPEYVGGDFDCCRCKNLTSLEGAPEFVGGYFDCYYCGKQFTKDEVRAVCNVKKKARV